MLSYDILKDKPKVILAFTSLTISKFEKLLAEQNGRFPNPLLAVE